MNQNNPDAPQPLSAQDLALAWELGQVRLQRQRFYNELDGSLRALFSHCEWRISQSDEGVTELVVVCPSLVVYKRMHDRKETIHSRMRNTLALDHSKFTLHCPTVPQAFYQHEIKWADWSVDWEYDEDEFFIDDDDEYPF